MFFRKHFIHGQRASEDLRDSGETGRTGNSPCCASALGRRHHLVHQQMGKDSTDGTVSGRLNALM